MRLALIGLLYKLEQRALKRAAKVIKQKIDNEDVSVVLGIFYPEKKP